MGDLQAVMLARGLMAIAGLLAGVATLAFAPPALAEVEFVRSMPVSSTVFTLDDTDDILVARDGAVDRYSSLGVPKTGFTTGTGFTTPNDIDFAGGRIYAITPSPSRVWTWMPNGTDEAATSTATTYYLNLNLARGLAVAGGIAYVATGETNRVTRISTAPLGESILVTGVGVATGDNGTFETCAPPANTLCQDGHAGLPAQHFNFPVDIAHSSSSGHTYVIERGLVPSEAPTRIKQVSGIPLPVQAFGGFGTGAGEFKEPNGIAIDGDDENLFVADSLNHRVMQFEVDGTFVQGFGFGVDTGANQLETCTLASTCQAGLAGNAAGQLNFPGRVAVDSAGDVYVSSSPSRLDVFSLDAIGPGEKSIALKAKPKRVRKGKSTTLTATLSPCPATGGESVQFERFKNGSWLAAGSLEVANDECKAKRVQRVTKKTKFRANSEASAEFGQALSNVVTVRLK